MSGKRTIFYVLIGTLCAYAQISAAANPPKIIITRQGTIDDYTQQLPSRPVKTNITNMPSFESNPNIDYKILDMPLAKNIDFKINNMSKENNERVEKPVIKNQIKPMRTQPLPLLKPQLGPFRSPRQRSPLLPLPKLRLKLKPR